MKKLFLILPIIILFGCEQTSEEGTTHQTELNDIMEIDQEEPIENVVNFKGLYRLIPSDQSISVDIKINFKEDNNSDWITTIEEFEDIIPKKFKVFADALYITHDLEGFDKVISEEREKGREGFADLLEGMISQIPETDKYRIEKTDSDTIKLFGSRMNFNLIKIDQ